MLTRLSEQAVNALAPEPAKPVEECLCPARMRNHVSDDDTDNDEYRKLDQVKAHLTPLDKAGIDEPRDEYDDGPEDKATTAHTSRPFPVMSRQIKFTTIAAIATAT